MHGKWTGWNFFLNTKLGKEKGGKKKICKKTNLELKKKKKKKKIGLP